MKKIVFYSLINGIGSTTIGYQLARLFRIPFFQEQKNDLVYFLSNLEKYDYPIKQLDSVNQSEKKYDAIYDLKTANKEIFNLADAIIVLTNNSYIDILKTIATLQKISSIIGNKKPIHIVFNRLQSGNVDREKKYTNGSKELIKNNTDNINIKFSYIRTNLIYYRDIDKGRFFMDSFFKRNESLLAMYPEIKEVSHTEYLEMFFDKSYENIDYDFSNLYEYDNIINEVMINFSHDKPSEQIKKATQSIIKQNFNQKNIRLSKNVIRDIYSLTFKLGGIYKKEDRKHIEEQ